MGYRPITDIWFLARAKLKDGAKYYGAYLGGFPERARILLGASINDSVLHVCGGLAKYYPYKAGFGPNDKTLDLDAETNPDFLQDIRKGISGSWRYILADPPYSEADAEYYKTGSLNYPTPNEVTRSCVDALEIGGRFGLIHYSLPALDKRCRFLAAVGVLCGFNNRIRIFSVFERVK